MKITAKILLLLMIATSASWAKTADNNYIVEMILFHQDGIPSGSVHVAIEPDQSLARRILYTSQEQSPDMLDERNLSLRPVAYTLRKNDLEPMLHIGWVQSMSPWKSPDWRWIDTGQIHGLISITKGRFLHLDIDLVYQDPASGSSYPIKMERKMAVNELHYLDNPQVGMLMEIRRVE